MRSAEEKLRDNEIEDGVMIIDDKAFRESLIAVTDDNRAVYDFDLMVQEFASEHELTEEEAVEYIENNIVRFLPAMGEKAPIVIFQLKR